MDLNRVYPPDRLNLSADELWALAMTALGGRVVGGSWPAEYGGELGAVRLVPLEELRVGRKRVRFWPEPRTEVGPGRPAWDGVELLEKAGSGLFPALERMFVHVYGEVAEGAKEEWADGVLRLLYLIGGGWEQYRWCWLGPDGIFRPCSREFGKAAEGDQPLVLFHGRGGRVHLRLNRHTILRELEAVWPAGVVPARWLVGCRTVEEVRRMDGAWRRSSHFDGGGRFARRVEVAV